MSFTLTADLSGLNALLDDLGTAAETAARPAAQAASQVLYNEVRANVAKIGKKSGNLERAIYQAFSQDNSAVGKATYHVSWNASKAPHGHLVEYGHLQRYRYYQTPDGKVRPMVRPGMQGKTPPGRRASQAVKDAYYVTLPTPRQVAARPFVRPAASKFTQAIESAKAELYKHLDAKL